MCPCQSRLSRGRIKNVVSESKWILFVTKLSQFCSRGCHVDAENESYGNLFWSHVEVMRRWVSLIGTRHLSSKGTFELIKSFDDWHKPITYRSLKPVQKKWRSLFYQFYQRFLHAWFIDGCSTSFRHGWILLPESMTTDTKVQLPRIDDGTMDSISKCMESREQQQGWKFLLFPTFSYFSGFFLLFPTLGSNSYFFLLF